jgi:hypothetical protein
MSGISRILPPKETPWAGEMDLSYSNEIPCLATNLGQRLAFGLLEDESGTESGQPIVDGKLNQEIASRLNLSANTVAVHRANIMDALGIHKTAELVVFAIRNGLVNLP